MERETQMKRVESSGIFCGLGNKLREENGRWWYTRRWITQTVVWTLVINGISLLALVQMKGDPSFELSTATGLFAALMGWMVAFRTIIPAQNDIVEEKATGTAEWVLSAPLSRESFILSKFLVNLGWALAITVLLQGVVFEVAISVMGVGTIPWNALVAGLGLQGMHLLFWVSLVTMLGSFFRTKGAVIGIPMIFVFLQQVIPLFVGSAADAVSLMLPDRLPEYAGYLFSGGSIPSVVPLATVVVASAAFILLAVVRFNREEF